MSLVDREAKLDWANQGRVGQGAWPPPRDAPFWISRDTMLNGALDPCVDVWVARPVRCGHADYPRSHYWMSGEFCLSTRWGRWLAADVARWFTIPDTDRELIRVG